MVQCLQQKTGGQANRFMYVVIGFVICSVNAATLLAEHGDKPGRGIQIGFIGVGTQWL